MVSGNFHPAPTRLRAGQDGEVRRPTAVLPPGVIPPQEVAQQRRSRAHIPYVGPPEPNSHLGMVGLCMLLLGLQTTSAAATSAAAALGLLFTIGGATIGVVWLRVWWLWRRAWGGGRWR